MGSALKGPLAADLGNRLLTIECQGQVACIDLRPEQPAEVTIDASRPRAYRPGIGRHCATARRTCLKREVLCQS
jgi:hypothetical protein